MIMSAPRGTQDVLPSSVYLYQYVEDTFRQICRQYGYHEIRTPIFEHTELFQRGVGETTDIVQKEMYTFSDRSNRSLTLKPEGTAPTVRAYIEHKMHANTQPTKLYYITPIFRYERPQAGRYRQHEQCGIELFGAASPEADAEVILVADTFYKTIGLRSYELHINSVGCPSCRDEHRLALQNMLAGVLPELCSDCRIRYDRNPLRVLDCKNEHCRELSATAPTMMEHLCADCTTHYQGVQHLLNSCKVRFRENPRLVRGLDYYTNTAFEFVSVGIGAQSAIGGGGRYNGLIGALGGEETPGVGFGLGVERILLALELEGVEIPQPEGTEVFIATIGQAVVAYAFNTVQKLRENKVSTEQDLLQRSLKAQMKYAAKLKAKTVVIIGEDEIARGIAIVRDMSSGEQKEIRLEHILLEFNVQ
ncbi:MAG: histidine--tRNA ligase [bacterium]|nr:histidine--tRNA ligase [bacterium]